MNAAKHKKRIEEIELQMQLESRESDLSRARSITVGNAFGGVTEVAIRGTGERFLWILLQPAEVIELINQLAANVGCHIWVKPRKDFASWRQWKEDETDQLLHTQHPPWPHSLPKAKLDYKQQPGLQPALMAKETNNEQPMAIEKTVKRRSTKRTAKTS